MWMWLSFWYWLINCNWNEKGKCRYGVPRWNCELASIKNDVPENVHLMGLPCLFRRIFFFFNNFKFNRSKKNLSKRYWCTFKMFLRILTIFIWFPWIIELPRDSWPHIFMYKKFNLSREYLSNWYLLKNECNSCVKKLQM